MSAFIAAATTVVVTAATAAIASLTDVQLIFAPLLEGREHAVVAASVLATLPVLIAMTALAASGRE